MLIILDFENILLLKSLEGFVFTDLAIGSKLVTAYWDALAIILNLVDDES